MLVLTNLGLETYVQEPQFAILDDGPGQPQFQLFMSLNLQFK